MMRPVILAFLAMIPVHASTGGFTETLPQGAFLLDESVSLCRIDSIWDNDGNEAPLIEAVERYEPGGGKQGVIRARPVATYVILVNQLQYGVLDDLSLALGIPVVLNTTVSAGLSWEPGDYQRQIGRAYSEQDFWDWAASMGQDKPGTWVGNRGVLSDIVLGARFRFTDRLPSLRRLGLSGAVTLAGILPTGQNADPEELLAVGTSMWDLHFQGDLAVRLAVQKDFDRELDGRLTVGVEGFYEVFFLRELTAPDGEKHPLLLNQSPYVGESYQVKPGDFSGVSVDIEAVPWRGPARATWLTDGNAEAAEELPPILTVGVRYTFVHLQQSDWRSDYPMWDWEREKYWRPGYKNILQAGFNLSLLRLGIPVEFHAVVRTLSLIPGKNCRASDVLSLGVRVPMKFW